MVLIFFIVIFNIFNIIKYYHVYNVRILYRALSDTDSDGKMDINEFSIACKLINLKLRGFEIPKTLPSTLIQSIKSFSASEYKN